MVAQQRSCKSMSRVPEAQTGDGIGGEHLALKGLAALAAQNRRGSVGWLRRQPNSGVELVPAKISVRVRETALGNWRDFFLRLPYKGPLMTFPHLGDARRPRNLDTGREAAESGALAVCMRGS